MRRRMLFVAGVVAPMALVAGLWLWSRATLTAPLSGFTYQASRVAYRVQGALAAWPDRFSGRLSSEEPGTDLVASGFIQAYEIMVSTEVAGRVAVMWADVGDEVVAGQTLAQLDTALIDAQIKRAEAELRVAKAMVGQVLAGASPEEIQIAETVVARAGEELASAEEGVALAQANVIVAQAGHQAAQADLAKLRSGASTYELALAEAQLDLARRELRGAASARDSIGGAVDRGELPSATYDAAKAAVAQAETKIRMLELQLEELQAGPRPEDVRAAQAAVDAAAAVTEAAEAEVVRWQELVEAARASRKRARAQLDLVKHGATPEQIALAQAPVSNAQAARQVLVVKRDKMTLKAPRAGLVLERPIHAGETVLPGSTLFRLADLGQLKLTVYVPETDMGKVEVGQLAHVTVDSFPGQVFPGRVVYIAPRAEFTPSNVQTADQRVTQVFAVKIEMRNPDRALKPGMPAEATFIE
jgi:HlyD family secretion protein